jgi:hypothetical protein
MESTSVVLDQPLEKTVKILGFSVSVINVELYKSARLGVHISCQSGSTLFNDYKEIILSGTDYENWSNDDSYIITFVASKLPELTGTATN